MYAQQNIYNSLNSGVVLLHNTAKCVWALVSIRHINSVLKINAKID